MSAHHHNLSELEFQAFMLWFYYTKFLKPDKPEKAVYTRFLFIMEDQPRTVYTVQGLVEYWWDNIRLK